MIRLKKTEWRDIEYFDPAWDERVTLMITMIPPQVKSILDLGCGKQTLRKLIGPNHLYIPVDHKWRSDDTIVCDLNRRQFPNIQCDLVFVSGCLEYLFDPKWVIQKIGSACKYCLISYNTLESNPDMKDRKKNTWHNHLSRESLINCFVDAGFELEKENDLMVPIFLFGLVE